MKSYLYKLGIIFLLIFSCARNEDEFKDYNVGTLDSLNLKSELFVAVGNSGTILTSSDGTTWTSRTSGMNMVGLWDVSYGKGHQY